MKYKLAMFDFDGTLANSFPFFLNTVNELAEEHKFKKIDLAQVDTLRGYDTTQLMSHLGLSLWKVPIVANSFRSRMAQNIEQIPLFKGIEKMLQALSKKGVLLSLTTSNSYDNVCKVLTPKNMELMVFPQCGTSLFGKKSKLKNILRKTGVSPREAIYIGDETRDLEAASSENIAFGAVSWGYARIDTLIKHSPDEIFYKVEDITKKLS
jgi:phosphoglycolate phosphatase